MNERELLKKWWTEMRIFFSVAFVHVEANVNVSIVWNSFTEVL
jgi:hypothetical protein